MYDAATESEYKLIGTYRSLRGARIDNLIALARSLFEPPNPLPPPTTFRYDSYDTTGEVAEPGSYAFLADPADTSSAVSTYEALRDGTATALLIHKSDAHGASQAALYDAVEAGHLIEWQQAEDCFVRYRVTDVPAVGATAAYREFGVRSETYALQSCQTGSLPAGASAVQFSAASELPLDHLGGTNLTDFAVVHGVWQLTPYTQSAPGVPGTAPASVAVKAPQYPEPQGQRPSLEQPVHAYDLTAAERLPYWRTPSSLPADWPLNPDPPKKSARAAAVGCSAVAGTMGFVESRHSHREHPFDASNERPRPDRHRLRRRPPRGPRGAAAPRHARPPARLP